MTSADAPAAAGKVDGPPPPFDPELARALPMVHAYAAPDAYRPETLQKLRDTIDPSWQPDNAALSRGGKFDVSEVAAPGLTPDSPHVRLLVCSPVRPTKPLTAVYFMHGSGMVVGNNRLGIDEVLDWAETLDLAVVSVDYRLAPESPHPALIDDCYAGLVWLAEHAEDLGVDPSRIVITGTSAGGGLAASLALLARDRGGPPILGQLLICPMLDDRNDTHSGLQMAGLGSWDRTSNETGWNALLGDGRGGPDVSPYAAAARATDLAALPPAFIDVGSAETFRDEDVDYARRIWAAGGVAELHVWPGGFHCFDMEAPTAELSIRARAARVNWLRRLLADA